MVWFIILLLISVNALYVAAEFAAVGVRRSRIRQLAEERHGLALRLLPVLNDRKRLDHYIAACQVGITLSSLVLGAYAQAALAPGLGPVLSGWFGISATAALSTAAVVVLLSLTVLQMVFGELIPKSIALQFPTQTALYTVLPMRWSLTALGWFIHFLNGSGNLILRLMGASHAGHGHIHSPEEIDMLIAESRDGGLLEPDEQRRLHQALQLSVRPAHQLMVPRPHMSAVEIRTDPEALLRIVSESPYTRLPVYRGSVDHVVGMLHTKDLLMRYLATGQPVTAEEVMRPMTFISETVTADRLLSLMRKHRSRQAVIVDEFGGVAGLVTLENVLAEILGDGQADARYGRPVPERLPDGRTRLPGLLRLYEAEPWLGMIPESDADTVGGCVLEALGHLPEPGERVQIQGVWIEVEQVANRAVTSVLVEPPVPSPPPP